MKILCKICQVKTNHEVLESVKKVYHQSDHPDMQVDFAGYSWEIIKCMGCEDISFRLYMETSDDWNPNTDQMDGYEYIFPKRNENQIIIKPLVYMPPNLSRIYKEIINSFNEDLYILCASGLRAIIEGICAERKIIDGPVKEKRQDGTEIIRRRKNLVGKIEGLHEKGILTEIHAKILHEHRYLGNEALHKLSVPSESELINAIEIIELTLTNLYELEHSADKLRRLRLGRK